MLRSPPCIQFGTHIPIDWSRRSQEEPSIASWVYDDSLPRQIWSNTGPQQGIAVDLGRFGVNARKFWLSFLAAELLFLTPFSDCEKKTWMRSSCSNPLINKGRPLVFHLGGSRLQVEGHLPDSLLPPLKLNVNHTAYPNSKLRPNLRIQISALGFDTLNQEPHARHLQLLLVGDLGLSLKTQSSGKAVR